MARSDRAVTTQQTMSLAKLFRNFMPVEQLRNDTHDWNAEAAWLHANHPRRVARLLASITKLGIEEPIRLCYGHPDCGTERHVVDGHHRLLIARELGIHRVPVGDAWDGSDWYMAIDDNLDDDPEPSAPGGAR